MKNSLIIGRNSLTTLCAVILSAFCLIFYLFSSNSNPLLYATILLLLLELYISGKKLKIDYTTLLWLLVGMCMVFSFISGVTTNAIIYVISFFVFAFFMAAFDSIDADDWKGTFINFTAIFSMIHVSATLIQYIYPEIINSINSKLLDTEAYLLNVRLYSKFGAYAGLCGQTGRNGWYISIALGFWISRFLDKKGNRTINVLMIILSYVALILTHKRSFILIPIIIILVLLAITHKIRARNFVRIILAIALFYTAYRLACYYIPELEIAMARFDVEETGDYSTGRFAYWKTALEAFLESPVYGIGIFNIKDYLGTYAHNCYVQLLAEIGIIGFVFVILAIIRSLRVSIFSLSIASEEKHTQCLTAVYYQLLFLLYSLTGNPFFELQLVGFYLIAIAIAKMSPNMK